MKYTVFFLTLVLVYGQDSSLTGNKGTKVVEVSQAVTEKPIDFSDIFGTPPPQDNNGGGLNLDQSSDVKACKTENGTEGACVLYYQCDVIAKKIITDGATLIDIRNMGCKHDYQVCCALTDFTVTIVKRPAETTGACGYSGFIDKETIIRITQNSIADFMEFPWMVALLRKSSTTSAWAQNDYLGGGSLIHERAIITSAHKVDGLTADEIKCRAGEWDIQTEEEIHPYQERDVSKIIRHKDFYRPSVLNSVAILIVKSPFDMTNPNVGVGCLGHKLPSPGTRCWAMGWGRTKYDSGLPLSEVLKKVEVPLLSRRNCEIALRRTRLGSYFTLHPSLMCAGGEKDKDTCSGDGGAPLVCSLGDPQEFRYAIYGMVAYGIGCGDEGIPGVYVNTPAFYDWITSELSREGIPLEKI